ncbi:hypothetical protein AGLY_004558 [Aphis glycines]|uniref:Uncharacterized protein n=1 Tax=Aphis glycines TaxID=307491 RepID=A0A6G0U0R6_APHGL|nr:hypothetical protein AGLY_004558 [Aphis glycines]
MIKYWIKQGSTNLQNSDEKLLESFLQNRTDRSTHNTRKCSIHFCKRITKNREIINRNWLCFSPTTGTKNGKLSSDGFCDWKHAAKKLSQHETSKHHLEAIIAINHREREIGCLDQQLQKQIAEISFYWCQVLKRIVSKIKFISERGLSLKDHTNKKSGHTNYLSSTICEELIDLMAKDVLGEIITRIKKSKYYSVSVDSTSDEAHIDQLTIVVLYMETMNPVERFLTFVPNCGHTGVEMANTLIKFLNSNEIELIDCRDQSYDNAANMRSKYQEFVPCCGHSLNLVGKTAANSCVAAIRFFQFHTKLLHKNKLVYVLKNLNETRWLCRVDATKAVVFDIDEDDYNSSEEYLPPGNEFKSEHSDDNSVENGIDLENSEWNFDINTEPEFVDFTGIPGLRCNVPNYL